MRPCEAESRLADAISGLSKSIRSKSNRDVFAVSNDAQAVVKFITFADICTFRIPGLAMRRCRHPQHESANSGEAVCNEKLCPFVLGKGLGFI